MKGCQSTLKRVFLRGNEGGSGRSRAAEPPNLMKLSSPSRRCAEEKVRGAAADLTYLRLNCSSDLLAEPLEKVTPRESRGVTKNQHLQASPRVTRFKLHSALLDPRILVAGPTARGQLSSTFSARPRRGYGERKTQTRKIFISDAYFQEQVT